MEAVDTSTTIGIGLFLLFLGIIFIWRPWKKGVLDLTSREEVDDSMRTPAHIDPIVKEAVNTAVAKKRAARRKPVQEVGEVAVPARRARVKKETI